MLANKKHLILWLAIIFASALILQTYSFFNPDLSWAMHVADKMLHGGKYYYDYFEHNPPMVFYVAMPPVLLSALLKLNFIITGRIYVFLVIVFSLCLCWLLLKKIFGRDNATTNTALVILAVIYLLLPGFAFGEREHFLLLLGTPYLLLVALRIAGQPIKFSLALIIGIAAALGFAMKPFFVGTLVLTELYLMYKQKSFFTWLRTETLVIGIILICYLATTLIYYPAYMQLMVPYGSCFFLPYYFESYTLIDLYTRPQALFCYVILAFYLFELKKQRLEYKTLTNITALAVVGSIIAYGCQAMFIYYHTLPMVAAATVLLILILSPYVKIFFSGEQSPMNFMLTLCIGMIILGVPIQLLLRLSYIGLSLRNSTEYQELINYIKSQPEQQPVYFFSTSINLTYPLVDYTNAAMYSRFPGFWMLPSLYLTNPTTNHAVNNIIPLVTRRNFVISSVTEEFLAHPPGLVFIALPGIWPYADSSSFDYIKFFSSDPAFKALWKSYDYVGTVATLLVYKKKEIPTEKR